jgi:hypothetical protein
MPTIALVAAAISQHALAQPDVLGTWLWEVTTQDGDAVVETGETATFTLSMNFSPDVGEMGLTGAEILGLAIVKFDTLGMLNADQGHIVGWEILNKLDVGKGDVTTTDGVSLFGTVAAQPVPFWILPDDPIDVVVVEWAPFDYNAIDVQYMTSTSLLRVFEGDANDLDAPDWPAMDTTMSFRVVPAPSAIPLLATALWMSRRKSRSLD